MFLGILEEYEVSVIGPWCQNSLRSAMLSPTAVSMPKGVYPLAPPIAGS